MTPKRAADWRDRAAGELLAKQLARQPLAGRALVMEDPRDKVASTLVAEGLDVRRWWRRAHADRPATAWPPAGPFDVVALRLPRSKDELVMAAHAAATALANGGRLFVYGAKDEGAGSIGTRLVEIFSHVRTLAAGGHCRVVVASQPRPAVELRGELADWREQRSIDLAGVSTPWVSYPGVFAHGRLDRGTEMLLDHLPDLPPGGYVLDFGCGSGAIARVALGRGQDLAVDCLDVDAVALTASAENAPRARPLLGDGFAAVSDARYDVILSNPPYHRGKAETLAVVEALVEGAAQRLVPGGKLRFVAQRRLPVEPVLAHLLADGRVLAQDGTFRVWAATRPGGT